MSKKNVKRDNSRLDDFLEEVAISANVFIKRLLGIYDNEIMRAEITHKDLVKMFPKLQRTSYDAIMDDPSLVYTGAVVAVRDSNSNVVPYINMQKESYLESEEFNLIMEKEDWQEDSREWFDDSDEINYLDIYSLKSMSTFELTSLMNLYAKTGQIHDYEIVRRELISRKDSRHASQKSKQKALKRDMKRVKEEYYY